jgi:lactate dehydrogenase-like 2-hydroxyacid dehydrogenase
MVAGQHGEEDHCQHRARDEDQGMSIPWSPPEAFHVPRTLRQVVTVPHIGSATWTTRVQMGMVCLDNVTAVLEGRTPPNRVA